MKVVAIVLIIVSIAVVLVISVSAPEILSENEFLKAFITHEILTMVALIATIAIALIATIHIWFNELEEKHQKRVFGRARRELNQAGHTFVWLFLVQLLLLIIKSLSIFDKKPVAISLFNGLSLVILIAVIITLVDVLGVAKALSPPED
jgi:hypothetical protein